MTVPAEPTGVEQEPPRARRVGLVLVALYALLLLAGAFVLGRGTVLGETPAHTSADAGFLRDMQTHHAQAVEMATLIMDRTDDAELRAIAYDIATAQSQQMGLMYGWLQLWGLPQYGESMRWMSHDDSHHTGTGAGGEAAPMKGLATHEQLRELTSASGMAAERLFLELMIVHHEGGVEMAEAAVRLASHREVIALAEGMIEVQGAEIDLMTRLLDERR